MRRFGPIAAVVPALTGALIACAETLAPTGLDALRVSVAVSPSTITAGSPANVAVTLTNPTSSPVVISSCPTYFWVAEPTTGAVVGGSKGIACVQGHLVYLPLRIEPHQSKTFPLLWPGTHTAGVPPGSYLVFGWTQTPDHASPPAAIEVVPAP